MSAHGFGCAAMVSAGSQHCCLSFGKLNKNITLSLTLMMGSIPMSPKHFFYQYMPLVLSGKGDGLMNWVSEENTIDNILVVNLDNPTIDSTIPIIVGGGVTLKITGSVTFNGGLYRFDYIEGTQGRAKVDISELTINGTDELGKTKSPDIMFWREKFL